MSFHELTFICFYSLFPSDSLISWSVNQLFIEYLSHAVNVQVQPCQFFPTLSPSFFSPVSICCSFAWNSTSPILSLRLCYEWLLSHSLCDSPSPERPHSPPGKLLPWPGPCPTGLPPHLHSWLDLALREAETMSFLLHHWLAEPLACAEPKGSE